MQLNSRLTPHASRLIPLLLILYFWANGLTHLDRFPKIHEDESWQAAPGYTFWEEGRFGTDLFAGFYGMEAHYYGFMPLFPIMVGAALHLFGVGLFQARLTPLILTILTLALTHRLGSKLFSPWHGTVALVVLVTWRIAGPFAHLVSGIPLADVARIVRYDSAVPLFGLLALLVLVESLEVWKAGRLEDRKLGWLTNNLQSPLPLSPPAPLSDPPTSPPPPRSPAPLLPYLSIGLLAGLATLSHVYGAFWLPALLLALIWLLGWRVVKPALVIGAGFALALTPWLIFVASGWQDFIDQNQNYADRFGLFDFRFYLINLLLETERYDPILNGAKQSLGAWLWLIAGGLSLIWLVGVSVNGKQLSVISKQSPVISHQKSLITDHWSLVTGHQLPVISARLLITCLLTIGGLFALLISFKTFSYLATLWPLFAIVIAAGCLQVWQARSRWRWWRPLLMTLFVLAMIEGLLTGWRVHAAARQMTPYHRLAQAIAAQLPPQSRVMGLQHYWLGLAKPGQDYRSILVPIFWTNPKYVAQPLSFGQAADAISPQVILLDQIMLDFLAESSDAAANLQPLRGQILDYVAAARRIAELEDPTYGRMEIYQLPESREDWKAGRLE